MTPNLSENGQGQKSTEMRAEYIERLDQKEWMKSEVAWSGSMQSSAHAFRELLSIFLTTAPYLFPELVQS